MLPLVSLPLLLRRPPSLQAGSTFAKRSAAALAGEQDTEQRRKRRQMVMGRLLPILTAAKKQQQQQQQQDDGALKQDGPTESERRTRVVVDSDMDHDVDGEADVIGSVAPSPPPSSSSPAATTTPATMAVVESTSLQRLLRSKVKGIFASHAAKSSNVQSLLEAVSLPSSLSTPSPSSPETHTSDPDLLLAPDEDATVSGTHPSSIKTRKWVFARAFGANIPNEAVSLNVHPGSFLHSSPNDFNFVIVPPRPEECYLDDLGASRPKIKEMQEEFSKALLRTLQEHAEVSEERVRANEGALETAKTLPVFLWLKQFLYYMGKANTMSPSRSTLAGTPAPAPSPVHLNPVAGHASFSFESGSAAFSHPAVFTTHTKRMLKGGGSHGSNPPSMQPPFPPPPFLDLSRGSASSPFTQLTLTLLGIPKEPLSSLSTLILQEMSTDTFQLFPSYYSRSLQYRSALPLEQHLINTFHGRIFLGRQDAGLTTQLCALGFRHPSKVFAAYCNFLAGVCFMDSPDKHRLALECFHASVKFGVEYCPPAYFAITALEKLNRPSPLPPSLSSSSSSSSSPDSAYSPSTFDLTFQQSITWFLLAAIQFSHPFSLFMLSLGFRFGLGVPVNVDYASALLAALADRGYDHARFHSIAPALGSLVSAAGQRDNPSLQLADAQPTLESLAAKRYTPALVLLGYLHLFGRCGVPKDTARGRRLLEQALDASFHAQVLLGDSLLREGEAANDTASIRRAVDIFVYSAASGCLTSCLRLGQVLARHHDPLRLPATVATGLSFELVALAAENRHPRAAALLAWYYRKGTGCARNDEQALRWFQVACSFANAPLTSTLGLAQTHLALFQQRRSQGLSHLRASVELFESISEQSGSANRELGILYSKGTPATPRNADLSLEYFMKGASLGDSHCYVHLGMTFLRGDDVPQDRAMGVEMLRLAVTAGNTMGMVMLARFYLDGSDRKEHAEAHELLTTAAKDNHHAHLYLGNMYFHGIGVRRNYPKAMEHYDRTDMEEAAFKRAVMHAEGLGVRQDVPKAMAMLKSLAGAGYRNAERYMAKLGGGSGGRQRVN